MHRSLYFTFVVALLCYSSVASSRVVLSLYALALGAQSSTVGLLFATYYVFPFMLSWPIGRYSDRVGARWLLALGCLSGAIGMLIPYVVGALPAIFVAGALVGLSFAFFNVLLQHVVGQLSRPDERARSFGTLSMVAAGGNFVGPLLSGFAIDHAGHANASLWVTTLPGVALCLLTFAGAILPLAKRRAPSEQPARSGFIDRRVARILTTSSLVMIGQDLFAFCLPIYGFNIGLSASAIGAILASYSVASFVVRILMPRLIVVLGEEKLLAAAFYLTAVGSLLLPLLDSVVALAVVSFVLGFGMGCGLPVTTMMIFAASPEGRSGETLGFRQMVNNSMRVGCPVVFGFVASGFGILPCFWINALMMGAGGWLSHPSKPRTSKS